MPKNTIQILLVFPGRSRKYNNNSIDNDNNNKQKFIKTKQPTSVLLYGLSKTSTALIFRTRIIIKVLVCKTENYCLGHKKAKTK